MAANGPGCKCRNPAEKIYRDSWLRLDQRTMLMGCSLAIDCVNTGDGTKIVTARSI
jgi:hypothetical protein